MLRYLIALLLMPPCITIAQDHCTYINELERILKTDPELSAEKSIFAQPGNFLSVGNGYAPARPGFESTEEMVCAMKSHGFDMIWAGGDVLGCQNQRELGQKIEAYAKKFNQHVKAMLIEQGAYRQPHFGHPRQPPLDTHVNLNHAIPADRALINSYRLWTELWRNSSWIVQNTRYCAKSRIVCAITCF